ncbi:MAG: HEAT repeat domain-containing protein [Planctomycetes bacterium]|nr:HEAT repeat domain-containing protein [Planctomycetota bacterium]
MTAAALTVLLVASLSLSVPQDPPAAAPAATPAIQWQRSLADALTVQRATGRPLLLCVNMDGEVFCERFANTTYKSTEFMALTEGYVCLVASPDRHNEMDYDAQGNRIECPRFPGCTCSEHINVEPELFARWFNNNRNAPRHVGVGPDGKVLFDRFMDNSMQPAIDQVRTHRGPAEPLPEPSNQDLWTRRDAAARRALELRYRAAERGARLDLLAAAAAAANEPFDLLRIALRDDDDAVFATAAKALAKIATSEALIDVEDALARADDGELRRLLVLTLERLGTSEHAGCKQAAAHHAAASEGIAQATGGALAQLAGLPAAPPVTGDRNELDQAVGIAEAAVKQAGEDPVARLQLARANLAMAEFYAATGDKMAPLFFADAQRAADKAVHSKNDPVTRADGRAVLAVAAWAQDDRTTAYQQASDAWAAAVEIGDRLELTTPVWARLFATLGRAAAAQVYDAIGKDRNAVALDAVRHAAAGFTAVANHPHATEGELKEAATFFGFVGERHHAQRLLQRGITRMPWSRELHQSWRERLLADRGGEAVRRAYAAHVANAADAATARWFAGYAAIVVGELHTKDRRPLLALAAYDDCIDHFAASAKANADYTDSANHFAVLALGGRALLRLEAGDAATAIADLRQARELRAPSLDETDGLGRKPRAVAERWIKLLTDQGKAELAEQLRAAIQ